MKSNISRNSELDRQIAAVRGFSRFYTRKLGIIEPKLLDSPWTLQEARIIYEIADQLGGGAALPLRDFVNDPRFLQRPGAVQQLRLDDAQLAGVELSLIHIS